VRGRAASRRHRQVDAPPAVLVLLHNPGTPAVRGEQRDAGAAQVVETQLLREAGAGHRGPEMAGVKLCQRSGPPSVAVNTKPSRLAVGPYPAGLRFLAAQVAGIAYHDDQPRRHGLRLRATFSAAR
jgi:hypothetical protein